MSKTLLVFDIDDTLTQTAALHIKAFIQSLHELGVQQMDTNFGEYLHHTDSYISRIIYEKELGSFTNEKKEAFETLLFSKIKTESIIEVNGASQLIAELSERKDVAIAYATGSLLKPAQYKLKEIGVDYHPLQLVASKDIEERENIVSTAIQQVKELYNLSSFDRIISFGDGLWDLKTAKHLQVEFIGIGERNKEVMQAHGMTQHFGDWRDFNF